MSDFLIRAALAGIGAAMAAGLLGCFVLWRRLAYFGDATAHAAILGVALALGLALPVLPMVLGVALAMALLVQLMAGRGLAADAAIGVLSHGALALGLLGLALAGRGGTSAEAWLFGDILLVGWAEVAAIWAGLMVIAALLWAYWPRLLTATLNADLARSAGIDPEGMQLMVTLMIAALVGLSVKVVGALLITGLLIIPAATARRLAATPEGMALASASLGAAAAIGGLALSWQLDAPAGPAILSVAAGLFALSRLLPVRA